MHMKALPAGKDAFSRILEPLGYVLSGKYPLDKLKMCGFVYTHQDLPEHIAQYFVSELYTSRFSLEFEKCVWNLIYESVDPIDESGKDLLDKLTQDKALSFNEAKHLLPQLIRAFARQHQLPKLHQYQLLSQESAEMAWIATEGNAFNHATDRVQNLDELEHNEKLKGRAMKPSIEVGVNASIRQTAYRASPVQYELESEKGLIELQVPGSFFEFIERGQVHDTSMGQQVMDLRFDSRNAQGIFKMTQKTDESR